MVSWRPLRGVVRSRRALTVSLVQLSCRQDQARGMLRALPWRVVRRRSGSRMVVGVRGGAPGPWQVDLVVCQSPARPRRCMGGPDWSRLSWAVPAGFVVGR